MATIGDPYPFGFRLTHPWGHWAHDGNVKQYGRLIVIADYVDGLSASHPDLSRPKVNPDRHARIRAKHFHYASHKVNNAWWVEAVVNDEVWRLSRLQERLNSYQEAHAACHRGVS